MIYREETTHLSKIDDFWVKFIILKKNQFRSRTNDSSRSSVSFYRYAHKKGKPVTVSFIYNDLFSANVINSVKDKIEKGYIYTAIIRVKYGINQYYMVSCNFGFKYDDYNDYSKNLNVLFDDISENL